MLVLMNEHHVYSDLWRTVLPWKVTMSLTPWLLLMGALEGHGLQAETAGKRTLAVNYGIGWLQNEKWWSYQSESQTFLFKMHIIVHTRWWRSSWTAIVVPYLFSEVKVLPRIHLFQDRRGTGLSQPLQLGFLQSLLSQLLCAAVAAIQIFNTGHPWLQCAGRAVFLKRPSHPGKQAGSCQDLEWIKLIENSNTFTHPKWKRGTLPVANANEELLGQLWKCFLCNRFCPCDVKDLCVRKSRDWNQHRT